MTRLMTRHEMKRHLLKHGIPVQQVGYWQRDGLYVADFYNRRMDAPVQPAAEYADAIRAALPGVEILDAHNTLAHWREGRPVVWASVTFRAADIEAGDAV